MPWFEVLGYQGHAGANKYTQRKLFIRTSDFSEALKKYRLVPSMKDFRSIRTSGRGVLDSHRIPDIKKLSKQEEALLELEMEGCDFNPRGKWFYIRNDNEYS